MASIVSTSPVSAGEGRRETARSDREQIQKEARDYLQSQATQLNGSTPSSDLQAAMRARLLAIRSQTAHFSEAQVDRALQAFPNVDAAMKELAQEPVRQPAATSEAPLTGKTATPAATREAVAAGREAGDSRGADPNARGGDPNTTNNPLRNSAEFRRLEQGLARGDPHLTPNRPSGPNVPSTPPASATPASAVPPNPSTPPTPPPRASAPPSAPQVALAPKVPAGQPRQPPPATAGGRTNGQTVTARSTVATPAGRPTAGTRGAVVPARVDRAATPHSPEGGSVHSGGEASVSADAPETPERPVFSYEATPTSTHGAGTRRGVRMSCATDARQAEMLPAYAAYIGCGASLRDLQKSRPPDSGIAVASNGPNRLESKGRKNTGAADPTRAEEGAGEGGDGGDGTVRVSQLPRRYYGLMG